MVDNFHDLDPQETQEWMAAIDGVIEAEGVEKAKYLLHQLIRQAAEHGVDIPYGANTPYINTIPEENQPIYPGDHDLEQRLRAIIRWNAMAMVARANKLSDSELGGHIGSFSSSATIYEVAQNHFLKGPDHPDGADLMFFQGHVAPGMYSRAYLEGRLDDENLRSFRQEVENPKGLSSYPHPWLMPDFWQFPTVSMGLGPIQAIYQARFMKHLQHRNLIPVTNRKVWAVLGDGEMDEPESRGALAVAAREKLDNLIFIVNCNLQRLDGPVRGNGKIIQELEGDFRGAGWQVIKVIWGSEWDELLAKDKSGKLMQLMEEVVDGEYQSFKAKDGAFVRQHFFGRYPETAALVKDMTDDELFKLHRGGHDPRKLYAAYKVATETKGKPVVILAKTVKGYGLGPYGEAANTAHNTKKLDINGLKYFRDRFRLPISDEELEKDIPFYKPDSHSDLMKYLRERRQALGGFIPQRRHQVPVLAAPDLQVLSALLESSGEREMSTTMAFVRILSTLFRDKGVSNNIVAIVPDEARTFGMEGLFRQVGIYDPAGQLYEPVDRNQVSWYKQSTKGQVFQEGINEAGSMASWMAAATAYANYGIPIVPFYIYYSMFGFQRIGDLAWAAGDIRARGFLIGGTAGRTTLAGEGLQHNDGHNIVIASQIPSCMPYDPTFAYEMAVIIQHGMKRMFEEQHDEFFYITAGNENYSHPAMPAGCEEGIRKGLYLYSENTKPGIKAQLMGSGAILREVIKAAELLEEFGVSADVWSATSFTMLSREAYDTMRHNQRHPDRPRKEPYVTQCLMNTKGPIVAATDYVHVYADQIRQFVPREYRVLGTDGYGRSDTRKKLRHHFEVDANNIAYATMYALFKTGDVDQAAVLKARNALGVDPDKANPLYM